MNTAAQTASLLSSIAFGYLVEYFGNYEEHNRVPEATAELSA